MSISFLNLLYFLLDTNLNQLSHLLLWRDFLYLAFQRGRMYSFVHYGPGFMRSLLNLRFHLVRRVGGSLVLIGAAFGDVSLVLVGAALLFKQRAPLWVFYLFSSTYSIFSLSITESGIILLVI